MEADWINESKKIYFAGKKKAFRPGAELAWKVVRHAPKWIQESDPRQVSSTSVAPGLAEQPKAERPIGQTLAKKRRHESSDLASDDSKAEIIHRSQALSEKRLKAQEENNEISKAMIKLEEESRKRALVMDDLKLLNTKESDFDDEKSRQVLQAMKVELEERWLPKP